MSSSPTRSFTLLNVTNLLQASQVIQYVTGWAVPRARQFVESSFSPIPLVFCARKTINDEDLDFAIGELGKWGKVREECQRE